MRLILLSALLLGVWGVVYAQPGTPTGFAVSVSGQRADLSWTNPGTQTYTVIERRTGALPYTEIYNALSFVTRRYDTTVLPSTTYVYRLKACNASGCSGYTSEQTAVIGAAPAATGSITLSSSTAIVGEAVLIDARVSTNFCKRPQSDGSPSITLSFGDGFSTNLLASGHAYLTPGSYTVRLNGKNCSGVAATEITASITVSAVPTCTTTAALSDTGNAVTNATNLQALIVTAAANNTGSNQRCITLPSGIVIQGPITETVPTGNNWIQIYWDSLTVPFTTRVFPADMASAPIILNKTASNEAAVTTGANPNPATHHYIWRGIHFKRDSLVNHSQLLFDLGRTSVTAIGQLPHHHIIDRCWFDAGTGVNESSKDGLNVVADLTGVFNSYFAEFKRDEGADPTGMSVSGGRGPTVVWNNEFIADGENFSENNSTTSLKFTGTVTNPTTTSATLSSTSNLNVDDQIAFVVNGFPGAAFSTIVRSINAGTRAITFDPIDHPPDNNSTATWEPILSFVEYRRNYSHKLLKWKSDDPSYVGVLYNLKNLWETKSGRYHVIQGNVFRYAWRVEQPYAFVIGSACAECGLANTIREFDISNNLLWDMHSGPAITSSMPSGGRDQSQANSDFHYRNNLHINVGTVWSPTTTNEQIHYGNGMWWGGTGQAVTSGQISRMFVINNTFDNGDTDDTSGPSPFSSLTDVCNITRGGGSIDSMFHNNNMLDQGYGFHANCSLDMAGRISLFFQAGDPSTHTKNLVVNLRGHTYPAADFTTSGWTDEFVSYANKNFTLATGSLGKTTGTNGADTGADISMLQSAIGASSPALGAADIKVVNGDWSTSTTASFPVSAVIDNFNRSNEGPPMTGWANINELFQSAGTGRGFEVISNQAQCNSNSVNADYKTATTYGPDVEVYTTIVDIGVGVDSSGLSFRVSDPTGTPNGYLVIATASNTIRVYRINGDSDLTQLGSDISQTVSDGDSIGVTMIGSTITVYYKVGAGAWNSIGTRTDSTYSNAGYVGLWADCGSANSGKLDDFGAGTLNSVSFPSNRTIDDFNRANEGPLMTGWANVNEMFGSAGTGKGLEVISNQAQCNSNSVNMDYKTATTYGPNVEAYVTIVDIGVGVDSGGIAFRLSDPGGTPTGYLVLATASNNVRVYRIAGDSSLIQLGSDISQTVSDGDSIGVTMIGSTITVYYKVGAGSWNSIGTRTDSTYSNAGYIGLWADCGSANSGKFDDLKGGTL